MLNFIAKAQRVLEISCGNESVTDRQKDGRTDGQAQINIPHFSSGGQKIVQNFVWNYIEGKIKSQI